MNLNFLKNPFISGAICSIIIIILFYLDSKITKKKKQKKEYFKIFFLVFFTVSILIYVIKIHGLFTKDQNFEKIVENVEKPIFKEIKKNLDTGIANF